MRFGGPILEKYDDPAAWVAAVKAKGYRAAYCPLAPGSDAATVRAFREAAEQADIVIAEVGAWSNPIATDPTVRRAALEKCKAALALADEIGAACCVNITGSRGERWDGPHPANLSEETFEMIVASVREIIDAVQPRRTFYTLETMPWVWPDSTAAYVRLLAAIDRPALAVHFDPVNLVNSPPRYYDNAGLIREFVATLGAQIRSVHLKDIVLREQLTVHLDEVLPGTGGLALGVLLRELARLDADLPVMLEHLPDEASYDRAATNVRRAAAGEGLAL